MTYLTIILTVFGSGLSILATIFILLRRHSKILEAETRVFEQEKYLKETIIRAQNVKEMETAQRIASEFLHSRVINKRLKPHIGKLERLQEWLSTETTPSMTDIAEKIQDLKKDLQETRAIVRDISRNIFPPFLSYLFSESCEQKLQELAALYPNNGLIKFKSEGDFKAVELSVLYNLYSIIDNFVTNSLQNAAAKHITVTLSCNAQNIVLKMSDDGVGFDFAKVAETDRGIGIAEIQGRANILAPQYVFQSKVGAGTQFEINIAL